VSELSYVGQLVVRKTAQCRTSAKHPLVVRFHTASFVWQLIGLFLAVDSGNRLAAVRTAPIVRSFKRPRFELPQVALIKQAVARRLDGLVGADAGETHPPPRWQRGGRAVRKDPNGQQIKYLSRRMKNEK
jgi:hypothetical protein